MYQTQIFPVTTYVQKEPLTLCREFSAKVFEYPFFNEGTIHCKINGGDFVPLSSIGEEYEKDLLDVAGFIFHTSHCGSTLLSRMLGSFDSVRVVSETEAINGLLLSYFLYGLDESLIKERLHQIIQLYRSPLGPETKLIFKLSSWNVFLIRFFLEIYPNVKWMYIDRNTEEVVASLVRSGGGFADWWHHSVDELRQYFIPKEVELVSQEDYLREMVNRHRYFAQSHMNKQGCYLKYPDFLKEFEHKIWPHFNLAPDMQEVERAMELLKFNAKSMDRELFFLDEKNRSPE